nr:3-oxo-delta(4,5)-steroid 5-beta-reductase [Quercus suber]
MSWWWARSVGAAKKKYEEDFEAPRGYQSVGLVIGVTGIVGNSLAEILRLSDSQVGLGKSMVWHVVPAQIGTKTTQLSTSNAMSLTQKKPNQTFPTH